MLVRCTFNVASVRRLLESLQMPANGKWLTRPVIRPQTKAETAPCALRHQANFSSSVEQTMLLAAF